MPSSAEAAHTAGPDDTRHAPQGQPSTPAPTAAVAAAADIAAVAGPSTASASPRSASPEPISAAASLSAVPPPERRRHPSFQTPLKSLPAVPEPAYDSDNPYTPSASRTPRPPNSSGNLIRHNTTPPPAARWSEATAGGPAAVPPNTGSRYRGMSGVTIPGSGEGHLDYDAQEEKASRPLSMFSRANTRDGLTSRRELPGRPLTVGERLEPTLVSAKAKREEVARKARMSGLLVNAATGLQILLSALITGLAAAGSGRTAAITTSIFGGIGTLVSSYLAGMRASKEPETSRELMKNLDSFIRETEAAVLDCGWRVSSAMTAPSGHAGENRETKDEWDNMIEEYRKRLEDLLGNPEDKKIAPPG